MSCENDEDLTYILNYVADTLAFDVPTIAAQQAANVWAETDSLALVGALNVKAGTSGLDLAGVLNILAGTVGLDVGGASSALSRLPLTFNSDDYSDDYARA